MSAGSATRLPDAYAATLFPSTLAINGSPAEVITPVIFRAFSFPCGLAAAGSELRARRTAESALLWCKLLGFNDL